MQIFEDCLRRNARLFPNDVAIEKSGERLTYSQLWTRVEERAAQMDIEGKIIPFRAVCGIDTLVHYFAIHLSGGIAMPLEKDLLDSQFAEMSRLADTSVPEGTADVLFTTGTTGRKKGVIISHAALVADAENLVQAQGYHHGLNFIISGPLNHLGSLSKVYPTLWVGGTIRLLDGMKDPGAFFRLIEGSPQPVASFLVPASLRMLMAFSSSMLSEHSRQIEFLETGASAISLADMQSLCRLLPLSRLYNTYASTETGIISTFDFNRGECIEGCVGRPMKHSSFIITPDGRVACQGPTVMSGYLGDESLSAAVMHEGMVFTCDMGRVDGMGRLHLQGRSGDIINVGGYKVSPTEVESAAMSLGILEDCVCIPSQHRVLGTVLKLLVVLPSGILLDKRTLARALQSKLESYKIPMLYEQVSSVRRTFNGKIDRKAYLSQ